MELIFGWSILFSLSVLTISVLLILLVNSAVMADVGDDVCADEQR
jgi:hypothetical protein